MATRINWTFVLLLFIAVFIFASTVGGLWVLQIRADTGRHMKAGDAMMVEARALEAAGDDAGASVIFEKALNEYGRAVHKEPADLGYLRKVEEALLSLRPMSRDQANEFDDMRISILRREVRYQPGVADVHLDLVTELHRIARWFGLTDHWLAVAAAADDMYESLEDRVVPYAEQPDPGVRLRVRRFCLTSSGTTTLVAISPPQIDGLCHA